MYIFISVQRCIPTSLHSYICTPVPVTLQFTAWVNFLLFQPQGMTCATEYYWVQFIVLPLTEIVLCHIWQLLPNLPQSSSHSTLSSAGILSPHLVLFFHTLPLFNSFIPLSLIRYVRRAAVRGTLPSLCRQRYMNSRYKLKQVGDLCTVMKMFMSQLFLRLGESFDGTQRASDHCYFCSLSD